jgi:hypothetical protein
MTGLHGVQVLEILNDSEVRQLQENGPPVQFGEDKKRKLEEGGMLQWWQRLRSGQEQPAEQLT